eukprot:6208081-Pleurochrysis_carterae.AAC.1
MTNLVHLKQLLLDPRSLKTSSAPENAVPIRSQETVFHTVSQTVCAPVKPLAARGGGAVVIAGINPADTFTPL